MSAINFLVLFNNLNIFETLPWSAQPWHVSLPELSFRPPSGSGDTWRSSWPDSSSGRSAWRSTSPRWSGRWRKPKRWFDRSMSCHVDWSMNCRVDRSTNCKTFRSDRVHNDSAETLWNSLPTTSRLPSSMVKFNVSGNFNRFVKC